MDEFGDLMVGDKFICDNIPFIRMQTDWAGYNCVNLLNGSKYTMHSLTDVKLLDIDFKELLENIDEDND